MGRAKAKLPFGPETMLERVVRRVGEAVGPVVVAAASGQALPSLPPTVRVVCDRLAGRGPLEGIRAGLAALGHEVEAAFVTACDVPFLLPEFVDRMTALSAEYDAAVPHVDGRDQPLAAVYRPAVLPHLEALLAADRLRPAFLFDEVRTRRVGADELTAVDPELASLANVNTTADYLAALARAGLRPPEGML
jgi:molybdopterin-guanine dinucleotide biosynthesis protein A